MKFIGDAIWSSSRCTTKCWVGKCLLRVDILGSILFFKFNLWSCVFNIILHKLFLNQLILEYKKCVGPSRIWTDISQHMFVIESNHNLSTDLSFHHEFIILMLSLLCIVKERSLTVFLISPKEIMSIFHNFLLDASFDFFSDYSYSLDNPVCMLMIFVTNLLDGLSQFSVINWTVFIHKTYCQTASHSSSNWMGLQL